MVGEFRETKKRMVYDKNNSHIGIFPIIFDGENSVLIYKGFRARVVPYNGSNQKFQILNEHDEQKIKSILAKYK